MLVKILRIMNDPKAKLVGKYTIYTIMAYRKCYHALTKIVLLSGKKCPLSSCYLILGNENLRAMYMHSLKFSSERFDACVFNSSAV